MTGDAEYYTLEWRGRQTPPMDYAAIREALEAGEINSMYKINAQGRWRLLRDFLEDYTPPRPPAPAPAYEPPPEPAYAAAAPPPPPLPAHPPAASWQAAALPPPAPAPASSKWPMYALIGLVVVLIPVCVIGGYVLLRPQPVVQAKAAETKPAEEKPAEKKPAAEAEKPKPAAAAAAEPEPKKSPGHNLSIEEVTELKSDFVVRVSSDWKRVDKKGDLVEEGGIGSGVHISNKDGYAIFVTNRHVLAPPKGYRDYSATMIFKGKEVPVEILGIARYSVDLAKIRVKYPEGKEGPVLDTMKLENLKVGQSCVAIGNALGFGISVTSGIISRFDEDQACKFVRTSAPISGGNSGGALFRQSDGALIGITTSSILGSDGTAQNINLAIPVDYIFSDLFWLPLPD